MSSGVEAQHASGRCVSCGAANASGSRFCSTCGASLDDQVVRREERKLVSVLFVDLVGFTARSDRADPEDVRELLRAYHAEARRRIEQHGGILEKFIGDAVMAVFGAPVAHGDDAERAVRAGLRVLEGIETLNRDRGLGLAARAAVNTGEAVVSLDRTSGEALATGDVVNTAARLQSAAPSGRLIVGQETYRASRGALEYERHGAVEAKGKAEAPEAWLAVAARAEPGERRVLETPLIGRSHELELMRSIWRGCVDEQRPHLVTVIGPPGIGKSRLCREFKSEVNAKAGVLMRGRCLPYEERVGYQAFTGIVRAACGIFESDAPRISRQKLHAVLERLMPETEAQEVGDHLALLLGMETDAVVPQPQMLFFYARRFLECLGAEHPTVVVFEDIHWAQASELDLLQYLGKHLRDSSVMLLAAARPELLDQDATWGAGLSAHTMISLEPLRAEDASALAGRLVDTANVADSVLARVVETAGGNPLFLEELAAAFNEQPDDRELPVTVREAIAARIDALPTNARSALLSAAIVGRTFWSGVVEAIGDAHDISDALAVLEEKDFIRRDPSSQLADDIQFTFKHMLIRDVAYGTVPRAVRRRGHAAVAAYIEHANEDATDTLSMILAHHWREAGEPTRAIPYLTAAAEAARRSWAQDAAIDLYTLAIELADDSILKRQLRLRRCIALVGWWEMERAAEELIALLPELEGQERLDALVALGHAYVWTERDNEALATAHEAAEQLGIVDDATAEAAVVAMESQALAMRGDDGDLERAFELGERSLELWVPGARPLDLAHQLHLHTDTSYWTGNYERALELARRTRAVASDVHVAEAFLRGGGSEALSLAGLGRHKEALVIWEELLLAADELGRSRRGLLNYSALAYRELYDTDEARRRSEESLDLSPATGFGMPKQFAGSDLLFTELLAGDVGRAQIDWPKRWKEAEEATAWTTWLVAGRLAVARAEIALQAETSDSALEWATRALELARRTLRRKYEARSLTLLGQALVRLGRKEEALEALLSAVPIADALIGPPARWHARHALAESAYELGEDDVAATAFQESASLLLDFAATLNDDRTTRFLATPQVTHMLSHTKRVDVA